MWVFDISEWLADVYNFFVKSITIIIIIQLQIVHKLDFLHSNQNTYRIMVPRKNNYFRFMIFQWFFVF